MLEKVESSLLNEQKITVESFVVFCVFHKINVIIKDNFKYLEIIHDEGPINIIEKSRNKYGISYNKFCKEKFWKMTGYNFDNPLFSISKYKLKDLQDICKILNIDIIKKRKKDLYSALQIKIE